jgi:putative hydrolase of HD superfamily
MHERTAQALLALYSQVATLKLLPRTGWLQRGVAGAESVAEHTFGVLALALFIGDTVAGLDRRKLLAIALLHDLAEATLSDLPTSARRVLGADVKHAAERHSMEELVAQVPGGRDYMALWDEYAAGSSAEARLVKGIDRLETLAQALAYERAGNRNLGEFWEHAAQDWGDEFPILRAIAERLIALRTMNREP